MSLKTFTQGYVEALLWSSNDVVDGEDIESLESYDLAPEALAQCEADCARFYADHEPTWRDQLTRGSADDDASAGHDFWLTRAGHGAGFWDGDWSDVGDLLTDACKAYRNLDPYIGDNGLVYLA